MTGQESKKSSVFGRPLFLFGVVMFIVYLLVGLSILFLPAMLPGLQPIYRIILGSGMIGYAAFRFYRILRTNSYR